MKSAEVRDRPTQANPVAREATIDGMPMSAALRLLEIEINPNTATEYRKWLGLKKGQLFNRSNILRLHKMHFFVSLGSGGTYYSKPNFARMERETPDLLQQELQENAYRSPDL